MDIVVFVFDRLTALDAVGPYESLSRLPGARVRFVGKTVGPMRTDNGMLALHADEAIADVDRADLLLVPGGWGTRTLEKDEEVLDWVRRIDATTTRTTSVCTGSLVLGAAGLLEGKRATSHWAILPRLTEYGAEPVSERIVRDGKTITAAGVSAGIDMGLSIVAELAGPELAQAVQLGIEYDPQPPFDVGSVEKAPPKLVEVLRARMRADEAAGG
jgi:transcriptional regulator GlxA family with amidase domain